MKKFTKLMAALAMLFFMTPGLTVWGQAWEKATSIQVGDVVVLVTENSNSSTTKMELTGFSTTSTVYGIGTSYSSTPAGTYTFEVVAGKSAGTFAFKHENSYLNWASGNSLNVNSTLSNNTSWTVSIDETNSKATIKNAADNNRQIWWNVSSPRFACYTGKTEGNSYYITTLYKQAANSPSITADPVAIQYGDNNGQITYTLNTQGTTGAVSASVPSGSWITLPQTNNLSSPVSFTCSANPNATYRTETVTLTYNYTGGDPVSTNVTITQAKDPDGNGSEDDPFSVAEAIAATPASGESDFIYVSGIVSGIIEAYNSQYGNISYNISADGETTGAQLEAFRGKGLNNENFTSDQDILQGDEVTIYGKLTYYNSTTYELASGNYLVAFNRPVVPTWNVTYHANGGNGDDVIVSYNEGANVTVAANTFARPGYTFVKWNTLSNGTGTDYEPEDVIEDIDDDIDLYAQWQERNETVDCLDHDFVGITTSTYNEWSGKQGESGAVYAGQSGGGDNNSGDCIQIRSNNSNSGIVTTASGGRAMKVTVTWNSTTADAHVLNIYGSNVAYENPTQLYGDNVIGTLIGTIAKSNGTELNITGDYEYIGIRSANGAIYLDEVCITWGSASALAAPAIEPTTLTFVDSQEINITAPEGASIRYTLDGTNPTSTSGTPYDGPFTITNTTTVKAIAYNETASSEVTTATYTRVYNITLVQPTGGVISASVEQAAEDAEVTLTATPNVGYSFSSWSVNDGAVSVNNNTNTFTMPASDVTVTASFSNNVTTYTISFSINDKVEMTATVNNGTSIDLTKFVADVTTEGYIFDGWSETLNGSIIANQSSYMPLGDITLYPGYRQATSGDYTLVTDVSQLVAGNLIVIAANGSNDIAMSTTQNSNNRGQSTNVTKSGTGYTTLIVNGDDVCELQLGNVSGNWTFYDPNYPGFLFAPTGNSNYLKTQETNDVKGQWTISVTSTGAATITSQGGDGNKVLKYNASSKIFSCYTTGQQLVYLYTKSTAKSSKGTRVNVDAKSKVTAIAANVLVTVKNGGVVYLTGTNAGNASNLVVEDGGQLVSSNNVEGTMLKSVTGYGNNTKGGYYFISSPFTSATSPMNVRYMINTAGYDLYYFDQTRELEWITYKEGGEAYNPGFNLVSGKGYLYANKESNPLEFAGTLRKGMNDNVMNTYTNYTLVYDSNAEFAGWNLVGNPFTSNVTVSKAFYKMNNTSDGVNTTAVEAGGIIAPMEGVFVLAENADDKDVVFTVNPTTPNKSRSVNVNVAREGEFLDRAIVTMGEGRLLNKLYLSENTTTISIPQDGNDYAIVPSNGQNEMPVSFKASRNANYTISIDAENVEMNYLHLIDNMTGADVDLLQTPSYSFEAKTTDYESRFKLVFATGDNSNDDNFAFFSNGSFVINNDGEATLQVIDITGRILSSESINGCTNVNVNAASGVYMLRLINGDNVKVQKVVVK
jgi:uncharacterized repeat protein (TIGR02543 family)